MESLKIRNYILTLFAILQLIVVFVWGNQQYSDAQSYINLAIHSLSKNTIYPNKDNIFSDYIFAPLFVNYIALVLSIIKNVKVLMVMNVLFNLIVAVQIHKFCKNTLGLKFANITLILYCLYPLNYGSNLFVLTELPFMAFTFYILNRIIFNYGYKNALITGIIVGISNGVRPYLPLFIVLFICSLAIHYFKEKVKLTNLLKQGALFMAGIAMMITIFGALSYRNMGYFVFQSTTAGTNLIMGANPDADGSYNGEVFDEGKIGHITNDMTFKERDSFWKAQSIKWIKEKPLDYFLLIPKKLFFLYATDLHSLGYFHPKGFTSVQGRPYIENNLIKPFPRLTFFNYFLIFCQLLYMVILLVSCIGIVYAIKRKDIPYLMLLSYIILGTALILLIVGGSRYHYPFMPAFIVLASYGIYHLQQKYFQKKLG